MKNSKHLLCCLFLFLLAPDAVSAKDWRGLVPLRSTIEDVEKLLGKSPFGFNRIYDTEEGRVLFFYQSNPNPVCGKDRASFNVPLNTILFIEIEALKKKTLLADLNLDMSKFKIYLTCFGPTGYSNSEDGFGMHVGDGEILTLNYSPTAADAKQFACAKTDE